MVVTLAFGLWWVLSAHRWFTGPKVQGTPEELRAIEAELERLEVLERPRPEAGAQS